MGILALIGVLLILIGLVLFAGSHSMATLITLSVIGFLILLGAIVFATLQSNDF